MSIVAFSHLGVRSSTQITVFWQTKALLWPSSSVSAGEARLQQRPAHSRLACIVLSPSPSPFADNNPLHPPTARNGGHCCNRVHRPMRTANWANSVEPRAWQECRAPHTGTHTHLQPQCTARHTVGASGLEHISVPGSQTEDQRGRHRLILFVQPTVPRSPLGKPARRDYPAKAGHSALSQYCSRHTSYLKAPVYAGRP